MRPQIIYETQRSVYDDANSMSFLRETSKQEGAVRNTEEEVLLSVTLPKALWEMQF